MNAKEYKKKIENCSFEELEQELKTTIECIKFADDDLKSRLNLKKKIIEDVMNFDIPDIIAIDNKNLTIFEEAEINILSLEQAHQILKAQAKKENNL